MIQVRFARLAAQELADARQWYEEQQPGLGQRFNEAVKESTLRMVRAPLLYPVDVGDVRRCILSRFPYTLRYIIRGSSVIVLTVSHHHRHPDYWIDQTP